MQGFDENASKNHLRLYRMQAKKLRHDEEQKERSRPFRDQEVLQVLQEAHHA